MAALRHERARVRPTNVTGCPSPPRRRLPARHALGVHRVRRHAAEPIRRAASPRSLRDGEVLINSAAILDWLDQMVGAERALVPFGGPIGRARSPDCARHRRYPQGSNRGLRADDPASTFRRPKWIDCCRTQAASAIGPLGQSPGRPWHSGADVRMADPAILPPGRYPALDGLSDHCEARPEFETTHLAD